MALVILRQDKKMDLWYQAITSSFPEVEVYRGDEPHPKHKIKLALVWKHPEGSLSQYPNLMGVHSMGAGVDFIMEDPDLPPDLPVMRVIDERLASDMAEFVLTRILSRIKNIEEYTQAQSRKQWNPKPYQTISDYTIGIMGLGTLGKEVASLLEKVGFKLVGWTQNSRPKMNFPVFIGAKDREKFLEVSEILVCLLPLTPATHLILNKEVFDQLPKGAFVINVARGGHLCDNDLLNALDEGKISGAALDVFHDEPLPDSHPFWSRKDIYISPHVASVSEPKSVIPQLLENYYRLVENRPLINRVSREKGY